MAELSPRPLGTLYVRRIAGPSAPVRRRLLGRRTVPALYEVVSEDGSSRLMTRRELDRFVGAARVPADFWDLTHWAEKAFAAGDGRTFFAWPTTWPGVTLPPPEESFREDGLWIISSSGFWVRALRRSRMEYAEADRQLQIDAEALAPRAFVVHADCLPEDDRTRVMDNLTRAWTWAGYQVEVDRSWTGTDEGPDERKHL